MFKKKKCPKCNEKISENYSFCPNCGYNLIKKENNENNKDYGLLGQDDYIEQDPFQNMFGGMFRGFNGRIMNGMLNNAMKMLEKEMQKSIKEQREFQNQPINRTNFELYINGKRISPEKIRITKKPNDQNLQSKKLLSKQEISKIGNKNSLNKNSAPRFTNEAKESFQKLPKKQPETNVRRFSDKVIYEIDIPGVESINDISVSQMQNSIEIRAVSKENAYEKIIPIGLPITKYGFSKGKLVLELKED
jgi:HSP20 family molecular chaperone IbpA